MKNVIEAVLIVAMCYLIFLLGFYSGEKERQDTIENRAKEIKTLTQQQLEIVIFGKPQL